MKTSAGTYFRPGGFVFVLIAALLSSCATARVPRTGYAVASWYGPGFHGKLTASGERYDMDSLTCAHKRLAFGTRLRLTSEINGESVVVVVNDRGPFVAGRDLDLSREAARRLGIIGPGTGRVRVEVIGRDMRYSKGAGTMAYAGGMQGPYTVQVGAFIEESNAEHLRKGLELNYDDVYIMEKWIEGRKYYRVRVGRFESEKKAQGHARRLSDEGYDTSITTYGL